MNYLHSQSLGTKGQNLFVSVMPDADGTPDNCIAIFDETGVIPEGTQDYDIDGFGTQILVRGDYDWATEKIIEIHRYVPGWTNDAPIKVISTHIQSEPTGIGNDAEGRTQYSVHYEHYCEIGNNKHRTEI